MNSFYLLLVEKKLATVVLGSTSKVSFKKLSPLFRTQTENLIFLKTKSELTLIQ